MAEQQPTVETRDVSRIQEAFEEWVEAAFDDVPLDEHWGGPEVRYEDPRTHGLWLAFLAGFDASGKVGGFAGEESRG